MKYSVLYVVLSLACFATGCSYEEEAAPSAVSSPSANSAALSRFNTPTATTEPGFPRLANFYLHGSITPDKFASLSRWHLLILDNTIPESTIAAIKAAAVLNNNPNIKILTYVCAYCVMMNPAVNDDWSRTNKDYAIANNLFWYGWPPGSPVPTPRSDYVGTQMANITDQRTPSRPLGFAGPQGQWKDFIALRVKNLIENRPSLDGVFYDNFWSGLWNQSTLRLDSDCNPDPDGNGPIPGYNPSGCNIPDPSAGASGLDAMWTEGHRQIAVQTRQHLDSLAPRVLTVAGNSATNYFESLNGSLKENFPIMGANPDPGNPHGYGWTDNMFSPTVGYLAAPFRREPFNANVINAGWVGSWDAPNRSAEFYGMTDFERHKRFTLASALLGDGYYSMDLAQDGHGQLWWEGEYDNGVVGGTGYLGQARGPMYKAVPPSVTELIENGQFTDPIVAADWEAQLYTNPLPTGSFSIDLANYHSPPRSARIDLQVIPVQSNPMYTGGLKLTQRNVAVENGKTYTLTFWAKATVAQEIQIIMFCLPGRCINSNGRALNDARFNLTTAWKRFELTFVSAGTDLNATLDIFFKTVSSVWMDDISLREGETSVYRRDFDNGTVILNYTATDKLVNLGSIYRHLSVSGFNGSNVTSITVPRWDARILLNNMNPPLPQVTITYARLIGTPTTLKGRVQTSVHSGYQIFVERMIGSNWFPVSSFPADDPMADLPNAFTDPIRYRAYAKNIAQNRIGPYSDIVQARSKADFTSSPEVDNSDLSFFASSLGRPPDHPDYRAECDLNEDGVVDVSDIPNFSSWLRWVPPQ